METINTSRQNIHVAERKRSVSLFGPTIQSAAQFSWATSPHYLMGSFAVKFCRPVQMIKYLTSNINIMTKTYTIHGDAR